jgi:hypothetical protein
VQSAALPGERRATGYSLCHGTKREGSSLYPADNSLASAARKQDGRGILVYMIIKRSFDDLFCNTKIEDALKNRAFRKN